MPVKREPIAGRSAWRPSNFASKDDYSFSLTEDHLTAFDQAIEANRSAHRVMEDITQPDFALDTIAGDVAAWRDEVLHGRGFVILRELPFDRYSEEEITTIFWGLGTYLGRAVSQSNLGDRMGHVIDVGGKDRRERAYRNSRELMLHTDRADILGMLCLHKAMSGGVSGYASAHTIYNEMLATRPELVEHLFEGFHYHRRGEQQAGQPAVTPDKVPVLSEWENELSVVYLRSYIDMGAAELGQPLSEPEQEAIDLFEKTADRDDVKLEFTVEPGEVIFFNNCVLLHNRTGFEDYPESERKRHLLRLWLMMDGVRPLAPAVHAYKGTAGIQHRADGSTYYQGDAVPEPLYPTHVVSTKPY